MLTELGREPEAEVARTRRPDWLEAAANDLSCLEQSK